MSAPSQVFVHCVRSDFCSHCCYCHCPRHLIARRNTQHWCHLAHCLQHIIVRIANVICHVVCIKSRENCSSGKYQSNRFSLDGKFAYMGWFMLSNPLLYLKPFVALGLVTLNTLTNPNSSIFFYYISNWQSGNGLTGNGTSNWIPDFGNYDCIVFLNFLQHQDFLVHCSI